MMSALRTALRNPIKTRSSWACAPTNQGHALIRTFHSTVCRKKQFLDADEVTFLKAISKDSSQGKVVLVDFYANWCGPCKMLSPILEKLTATENADAIKTGSGLALDLVTVDTDANGELAMKYQVSSLPTVVAFKNGEPVLKFTGALPEPRVKDFIAQL